MTRIVHCLLIAALVSAAGCGTAPEPDAPATPAADPVETLRTIPLPDTVSFPEGITYDASAGALYTSSAEDGTVVRVDAATGAASVVVPGGTLVPAGTTTFPTLVGKKIDDAGRLWLAGGRTGKMWVVNAADGKVLKEATVPTTGKSLINDVAVVDGAGYFTDTFVPTIWRVAATPAGAIGDLEPWLDLTKTPITHADGPNLNGIVATPDGETLIVVQMNKGLLFTIDIASKTVRPIDTGGADLTGADGLWLDGDTLYVVRQTAVEIATVELNADRTAGTVVARFKDPLLAWPATAAQVDNTLVVVNTQFNTRSDKTTSRPFTLLSIPLSRLQPSAAGQ